MRPVGIAMGAVLAVLAAGVPCAALAQDMPPMPKPGPEHQLLKEDEGTWALMFGVSTSF